MVPMICLEYVVRLLYHLRVSLHRFVEEGWSTPNSEIYAFEFDLF